MGYVHFKKIRIIPANARRGLQTFRFSPLCNAPGDPSMYLMDADMVNVTCPHCKKENKVIEAYQLDHKLFSGESNE